jgi:hypothetical protein
VISRYCTARARVPRTASLDPGPASRPAGHAVVPRGRSRTGRWARGLLGARLVVHRRGPLPFRLKAPLAFSTACFRLPQTRSALPRRCSRLLQVTRPSSSVILPFIVCAWFLMVRETVMARPRCCPVDGSRGGWARREDGMLRWLFVCRCPNRPVLATPHHRGSLCPRPRPTHPGPRSNVCRTVRSRPVAPSAPAPPPQGYDGTSPFPPDGPAPPRSGGEHLHVTVTAVIVVLTFVAIGLAR